MCKLPCKWVFELLSFLVVLALLVMTMLFDFTILLSAALVIAFWRVSKFSHSDNVG